MILFFSIHHYSGSVLIPADRETFGFGFWFVVSNSAFPIPKSNSSLFANRKSKIQNRQSRVYSTLGLSSAPIFVRMICPLLTVPFVGS
jgi:hypothetical protein